MELEEQTASNQPSTSNSTNVDEQGQPIGKRQYNVQGDLVIKQYRGPPPVDVNPLAKELKNKLTMRANEIIGETILPIQLEREITRVKLQITKVLQQHIIYGDDYDWEEQMEHRHVPSIPTTDGSTIAINQLFDKAKETATRAAQRCKTDNAKAKYIKRHGNTIGLIGQPGAGKTTTSKMVTKSLLDKIILPETEYLFYISIKNVNFKKQVTPFQFLTDNILSNWHHCDRENKELINELDNNPNVVIVMDGLDEAATNFSGTPKNCPLDRKSKPVDIIKNLINSTLLPNAVKLVTSRPGQFYQIHPDCRPTFVLEVLGLDQDSIDELGTQICGERYPAIKKFLKERPNLLALCYVPANCILIMACLLICLSIEKEINSMTQVLIFALTHYMTSEHLKSNMKEKGIALELVKLCQLAFNGFKEQKLVFNMMDFQEVNIKEAMANNFMHTYVDKASGMQMKILDGQKRSYFSHLMWQEFLTAIHMMLFMPYQQFHRYIFKIQNIQWEVVARFMFGICNPTSKTDMELIFPTSEIKDFEEKKKSILDIISETHIDPQRDNFNTLLGKVSGWMHELDDKEIIKQVEQCLPTDITMKVPTNPIQARDLAFAFKSCSEPHNLTVEANDRCKTPEISNFLRGLQGSMNTRIKKLKLNGTELRNVAEYLVPHIQHIDELRLEKCKQLNDCMRDLCTAINGRTNMIVLYILSEFDENAASCLGDSLHKVSRLGIDERRISVQSRTILHEAVQQLSLELVLDGGWSTSWEVNSDDHPEDVQRMLQLQPGKIKKLKLKETELRNVAEYLVPHIQHIDELILENCKQLNDCMRDLCTAINDRPSKIKLTVGSYWRFDDERLFDERLKYRMLDDHAVQCLAGCVGKISKLDLDWNKLSPEGQRMLQEAIQQLPSPQIKLTVRSSERLDDHTAQCLAGCVDKISELDLGWIKLSRKGQRMLQEAIKQLPSPQIKLTVKSYWWLVGEKLNGHAAQCLAGCVGKISELDLNWSELSPEGQRMLQEAIQQLPSPQIKLTVRSDGRLVGEKLNGHAAQCLAGCVGNISELDLDWNKLSPEGQRMLQEAIQQLPSPQNFILEGHEIDDVKEWFKEYKSAFTEPKQLVTNTKSKTKKQKCLIS